MERGAHNVLIPKPLPVPRFPLPLLRKFNKFNKFLKSIVGLMHTVILPLHHPNI